MKKSEWQNGMYILNMHGLLNQLTERTYINGDKLLSFMHELAGSNSHSGLVCCKS